ncbi:hypothetical protein [Escherichia albertii]|uniref:hypothetical protein n=1 Tax=Escherichia albertii TaxID=208962 RepID=UPI001F48CC90|nr:hypothetical protein [Escherichia albertii]
MNDIKEQYSNIIEYGNSEQLIVLLKGLSEKSRKDLVPLIKKDIKRLTVTRKYHGIDGGLLVVKFSSEC